MAASYKSAIETPIMEKTTVIPKLTIDQVHDIIHVKDEPECCVRPHFEDVLSHMSMVHGDLTSYWTQFGFLNTSDSIDFTKCLYKHMYFVKVEHEDLDETSSVEFTDIDE